MTAADLLSGLDLISADPAAGSLYALRKDGPPQAGFAGYATLDALDDSLARSRFKITTQDEDREGDILITRGLDWSSYAQNPVVLLHHGKAGYVLPVGTSAHPSGTLAVEVGDREVYATCYHDIDSPVGSQVYSLVRRGILRGASIGFVPTEMKARGPKRGPAGRAPLLVTAAEVFEWSITPVGMNRRALRAELTKGMIDGTPIAPDLARALEPAAAERKSPVANGWTPPEEPTMDDLTLRAVVCPVGTFAEEKAALEWVQEKGYATDRPAHAAGVWRWEQTDAADYRVEYTKEDAGSAVKFFYSKAAEPAATPEPEPTPTPDATVEKAAGQAPPPSHPGTPLHLPQVKPGQGPPPVAPVAVPPPVAVPAGPVRKAEKMADDDWHRRGESCKAAVAEARDFLAEHMGEPALSKTMRHACKSCHGGLSKALDDLSAMMDSGPPGGGMMGKAAEPPAVVVLPAGPIPVPPATEAKPDAMLKAQAARVDSMLAGLQEARRKVFGK